MIDAPSITEAPLDDARVRKSATTLLMALIWLYSLEGTDDSEKRTDDFKQQKLLALRAAELAISDATGLQP